MTEKPLRGELKIQWYGVLIPIAEAKTYEHQIHAYDLVRLENNWIKTDEGIIVPKNGVLLITDSDHSIEGAKYIRSVALGNEEGITIAEMLPFKKDFSDMDMITLIKPYRTFLTTEEKIRKHLEDCVNGSVYEEIASDPKSVVGASVYGDSLFYAPSIDAVVLSLEVRPEYEKSREQIKKFFRRMVEK